MRSISLVVIVWQVSWRFCVVWQVLARGVHVWRVGGPVQRVGGQVRPVGGSVEPRCVQWWRLGADIDVGGAVVVDYAGCPARSLQTSHLEERDSNA